MASMGRRTVSMRLTAIREEGYNTQPYANVRDFVRDVAALGKKIREFFGL